MTFPTGGTGALNNISPAVDVKSISKAFNDTKALRDCSLTVYPGEVHAIVGENGSGKSTLAKVLGGIIFPDEGVCEVLGRPPHSPGASLRSGVALVMQEILVVNSASVIDNLFIGRDHLLRSGLPASKKRQLADQMMQDLVGEPVDLDAPIDSFPLSTRQWVVIARALLWQPRVLVLDESTAPLDSSGVRRLQDVVRKLASSGVCVLLVTHRIEELPGFAQRATVLRDGVSVGVLERHELTEERLLDLMSGSTLSSHAPGGPSARAQPGPPTLRARQLRLGTGARGVDIEVLAGEVLGVAALEGHGGQRLVEALAGIRRPAGGTIEFCGPDGPVVLRSLKSASELGIAYISGDRKYEGIFPNMSVLDNFGMALLRTVRRHRLPDLATVRRRFAEQATALSLKAAGEGAPVGSLSGGNQQKLLIGRALSLSPKALVLNDPTRGVDISTKKDLYSLLHRMARTGVAVVFFSTDIEELVTVAHRVAVLRHNALHQLLEKKSINSDAVLAGLFGQEVAHTGHGPSGR